MVESSLNRVCMDSVVISLNLFLLELAKPQVDNWHQQEGAQGAGYSSQVHHRYLVLLDHRKASLPGLKGSMVIEDLGIGDLEVEGLPAWLADHAG